MSNEPGFVTAFAPASIGNVAVGFDMLGLAISGAGDRVSARKVNGNGVHISAVYGLDGKQHAELAADASENTAGVAAAALWKERGQGGLELVVRKGVPLQSGMGSSAASAVAGAVAANALLDAPLAPEKLMPYALAGEALASGGMHADNVAPSLLGGLVFCPPTLSPDVFRLDVPKGISSVVLHPELSVNTAQSRRGLARNYTIEQWVEQQGYMAGFVAACHQDNHDLLRRCMRDVIIEPQRAASVSCFPVVRDAAMQAGALGCSLSGSGPSIFALCEDAAAAVIAAAMMAACRTAGIECQSWVSPMDAQGAFIEAAP